MSKMDVPFDFPRPEPEEANLSPENLDISALEGGEIFRGFETPQAVDKFISKVGQQIISLSNTGGIGNFSLVENASVGGRQKAKNSIRSVSSLLEQKHLSVYDIDNLIVKIGNITKHSDRYRWSDYDNKVVDTQLYIGASLLSSLSDREDRIIGYGGTRLTIGFDRYSRDRKNTRTNWNPYSLLTADHKLNVFPGKVDW